MKKKWLLSTLAVAICVVIIALVYVKNNPSFQPIRKEPQYLVLLEVDNDTGQVLKGAVITGKKADEILTPLNNSHFFPKGALANCPASHTYYELHIYFKDKSERTFETSGCMSTYDAQSGRGVIPGLDAGMLSSFLK